MKSLDLIDEQDLDKLDAVLASLVEYGSMSQEMADAIGHALLDIAKSVEKTYKHLVPNLLSADPSDIVGLMDLVGDIREEMRHINYHILDAFGNEI